MATVSNPIRRIPSTNSLGLVAPTRPCAHPSYPTSSSSLPRSRAVMGAARLRCYPNGPTAPSPALVPHACSRASPCAPRLFSPITTDITIVCNHACNDMHNPLRNHTQGHAQGREMACVLTCMTTNSIMVAWYFCA